MFPAGKKDGEAVEYGGGRTSADIVNYALDQLSVNLPPPEVIQVGCCGNDSCGLSSFVLQCDYSLPLWSLLFLCRH